MSFSPDTEHVLDFLDHAAGQGLRKRNDMGTLLELAAEHGAHEEMNDLVFHGRHLYNLYGTLRKTGAGAEGYQTLEREFAAAAERVRDLLARILVEAPPEQIERFETHYYAATQGSLRNLIDLAHDLGVLKTVQNDRKYASPESGVGSSESGVGSSESGVGSSESGVGSSESGVGSAESNAEEPDA